MPGALHTAGLVALVVLGSATSSAQAQDAPCVDCLSVRVGPPTVIRGPFPDELDAPFVALRLDDGSFRGFSANGATYALDGASLQDMAGPRREVLQPGPQGSINDCGRWLTALARQDETLIGFVHQERACDYERGRTEKSMAIATSTDDGLTWTDLGTVLTGRDLDNTVGHTGEGDCTMVDGQDSYLYAYCQRNSDWKTIVARASLSEPSVWHKYYEGDWTEPGLGGNATAIGVLGPGASYLNPQGWIAAVAADPWFGGVRLSVSSDKVTFADLDEPLLAIDGAEWNRPADSDLLAYLTMINPDDGSNIIGGNFTLAYVYVPRGKGFESRYLVYHDVTLSTDAQPGAAQVGSALARWVDPTGTIFVTSTGPLTGDRAAYRFDTVVGYLLTREPEGLPNIKLAECSSLWPGGHVDQMLAEDATCAALGQQRERTAGWLYAAEQPGTVPIYRCINIAAQTHFASTSPDCEGLGSMEFILGYGLAS